MTHPRGRTRAAVVCALTLVLVGTGCGRTVIIPPAEAARLSLSYEPAGGAGGEVDVHDLHGNKTTVPRHFEGLDVVPLTDDLVLMTKPGESDVAVPVLRNEVGDRTASGWLPVPRRVRTPLRVIDEGDEFVVTFPVDGAKPGARSVVVHRADLRGFGVRTADTPPKELLIGGGILVGVLAVVAAVGLGGFAVAGGGVH